MSLLRGFTAILLASQTAVPVRAEELPPPPRADLAANARLFVQLVINETAADGVVPIETDGMRLLIAAEDLRKAGVVLPDQGVIDLSARFDIQTRYDALSQRLHLDLPVTMLPTARLTASPRAPTIADASTGGALNYDLYVQRGNGTTMAGLSTEQRLFGRFGSLSNTGSLRLSSGHAASRDGYLRFDTRYRFIDQARALAVTAGDLITGSLPWTTSVRLGGLQIGRSFAARPDLVTTPLPSFAGEAAVPSTVDLFINGYKHERTTVSPGRFVLDDMPVVNGAGQATIVTTDAAGRQVATTIPFYVSAMLLKPGLTDFSAELGFLRRDYGLKSFAYGGPAASFMFRRGITPHLTLEGHGAARRGLVMGGLGGVWAPGLWGTLHATMAASRAAGRTGTEWTVGYDFSGEHFSVAFDHRQRSADFRDLGDLDGFDFAKVGASSSSRIIASASIDHWGSLGFSYIDARARSGERARLVAASWSLPLERGSSVFASADYDLRRHTASLQVRLVVPFGRSSVSGGVEAAAGRGLRAQVEFDRSMASDGDLGLSVDAAVDQHGNTFGQASATLRTRSTQFEAGGSIAARQTLGWAGLRGSLIAMDGGLFAGNGTASSFAVVSTGVGGVPVTYENQPIGKTDARGRLFIPDVVAYHPSRFAIDPLRLGAALVPTIVETRVAIAESAGVIVRMPIHRSRSLTASLVDAAGRAIPVGSMATGADGNSVPVGWDGIVYLVDIVGDLTLVVQRSDGGTCHAKLTPPPALDALADLGAIPCL